MTTYLDASAYLKLFLDEPGADAVRALWILDDRTATARLSYVEARAALGSARRARRLTRAAYETAISTLDASFDELDVVELTPGRAIEAGALAGELGLRAGDAIQLASALAIGPDVTFVAFDHRLRAAASRVGLRVQPDAIHASAS